MHSKATNLSATGLPPQRLDSGRHHVLYLVDRLQSTGGGAEGAIQKLCRFLPADRFRCSVATFWAKSDIQEDFPCPVRVFPLERIYGWAALKCGLSLNRFLGSEQVDIVHTFFPASDIWGSVVATLSRCPVLVSSRRDMGILRMRKHRIPYFFANRLFDQVQAVSEKVREFCIQEEDLAPERVVTVANGVDIATIDAAAPSDRMLSLGLEQTAPLIMTVANLRYVKGIDVLLRAISMVRREFPAVVFAFVGESLDAGYARELFALTAELGITQNTRFLGPRTDVFSLLKMADVFCLPSRTEGLSNALLEAMACGLPCVATDVGGNAEVLADGQSGFLVPSERPEVLAERLLALLRDQNLRRRMGNCGRQIVQERFTVQHMVDRLGMLYDDLLHRRSTSSARWRGQRHVPEIARTSPQ